MKYIKTFENQHTYNIGDYIKAYDNILQKQILNCFQIIDNDIQYYTEYIRTTDNTSWDNEKNAEIVRGLIGHKDIERLATTEEIKEFEIIKNTIKYNL